MTAMAGPFIYTRSVLWLCASLVLLPGCDKISAAPTDAPDKRTPEEGAPPTVVVIQAKQGDTQKHLRLPGTLEAWERAQLFAKVTGYVQELRVDIGDEVEKDQVLAKLSMPEMAPELRRASAEVPAAESQIEKAKADAELSRITYERLSKLREREPGAITQQEVDVASAKQKAAEAHVRALESGLDVAKAKVSEIGAMMAYATIKAPFAGVVSRRSADIGALVTSAAKDPILEVSRMEKLRLAVDLPEAVVPHVKVGQKVVFSVDALPGRSFEGTVSRTAGVLKPDTRSMRVEVDVDNEARALSPGMYAKVELGYRNMPGALTLPAVTIRSTEGAHHVLAVDAGGTVRRIPVTLLMDDGAEVVVTGEGLGAETHVVITAPPGISEGQAVRVRKQSEGEQK
jgi:RND family efflux transporter MFP subunit